MSFVAKQNSKKVFYFPVIRIDGVEVPGPFKARWDIEVRKQPAV